tara:strand:- start:59 stop:1168 length:1110 start_codon:yes stop_codon:yes gene_type:complete
MIKKNQLISLISVFTILIFNISIPSKVNAISLDEKIEILKDYQSTNELQKFTNLYFLTQTAYQITMSSFYKISDDIAFKYFNNEISLNDFKKLSNIEISKVSRANQNFLRSKALIPNSSKSKFKVVKNFYSDSQNFYKGVEIHFAEQLENIKKLVSYAIADDVIKYDLVLVDFILNGANIHDFTADYIILSDQLEPNPSLATKLNPLTIKVSRAIANLSRISAILTSENIDIKKLQSLHISVKNNLNGFDYLIDELMDYLISIKREIDLEKKYNSQENKKLNDLLDEIILVGKDLGYSYKELKINILEISNYTLNNYSEIIAFDINNNKTDEYNNLFIRNEELTLKNQELGGKLYALVNEVILIIQSYN